MEQLLLSEISICLKRALAADVGAGDVTTEFIVPAGAVLRGQIIVKQQASLQVW